MNALDEAFGLGLLKGMQIGSGMIKASKEDAYDCNQTIRQLALDYGHDYDYYNKSTPEEKDEV
jgi:hypothetical protein